MCWLTVDEVADLLKISRATVYRWINEGRLPCPVKVGGNGSRTSRFRRSDVLKHVDTNTNESWRGSYD